MGTEQEDADDEVIARPTAHYPAANISPEEFEAFVVELLRSAGSQVEGWTVQMREVVKAADGEYEIDATGRFQVAGMNFLVLVEAKRHANPIKRDLVQVLYQKMLSTGAQKAVMFSTSPFQSGALKFAMSHGIALATVTEGRFTFGTRSFSAPPAMSREAAWEWFGLPTYVAHAYTPGLERGAIAVTLLSADHPEYLATQLLGVPVRTPP